MDQLNFPIILPVPRPQGQAILEKLSRAGVKCQLTEAPPILGAMQAPDTDGWQSVEKIVQPDMVGIKVLPDPMTGKRLSQAVLEQIMCCLTLPEIKTTVIAYANLQVPQDQTFSLWLDELERTAVQMVEENKLRTGELAILMREIGRVDRCKLLKMLNQDYWNEEIEIDLKRWSET